MEWYEKIWLCIPFLGWIIFLGYHFDDLLDLLDSNKQNNQSVVGT